MRQANDINYADILAKIRVGSQTNEDIHLLKTRLFYEDISSDILHIYPTRKLVRQYNAHVQQTILEDQFRATASHYFSETDFY